MFRSVPTTATARAVNKRSPVHGALHSFNDVTSQFVAKEGGSRTRQQSVISAVAEFSSETPGEESFSAWKPYRLAISNFTPIYMFCVG